MLTLTLTFVARLIIKTAMNLRSIFARTTFAFMLLAVLVCTTAPIQKVNRIRSRIIYYFESVNGYKTFLVVFKMLTMTSKCNCAAFVRQNKAIVQNSKDAK